MHDTYFINIYTGEILTGCAAIHRYYTEEKHKITDAWTDEWRDTGEEAAELIPAPDFSRVIK